MTTEQQVATPPAPFPFGQVFFDTLSGWHEARWGQECLGIFWDEPKAWEAIAKRRR